MQSERTEVGGVNFWRESKRVEVYNVFDEVNESYEKNCTYFACEGCWLQWSTNIVPATIWIGCEPPAKSPPEWPRACIHHYKKVEVSPTSNQKGFLLEQLWSVRSRRFHRKSRNCIVDLAQLDLICLFGVPNSAFRPLLHHRNNGSWIIFTKKRCILSREYPDFCAKLAAKQAVDLNIPYF